MQTLLSRQETIDLLRKRDGYVCMFPGCDEALSESGKHMVTVDHIYPQFLAKADGWTYAQINDLSNLQLMGKTCNARKGHLLPDANGNYDVKPVEIKIPKADRPAICDTCYSGRILLLGEECYDCGSGPQPARWPTSLQKRPKDCDHSTFHCFMCVAYEPDLRVSATMRLIEGP